MLVVVFLIKIALGLYLCPPNLFDQPISHPETSLLDTSSGPLSNPKKEDVILPTGATSEVATATRHVWICCAKSLFLRQTCQIRGEWQTIWKPA